MDILITALLTAIFTGIFVPLVLFLTKNFFSEWLKHLFQKEHARFIDELQWGRKVQEQAAAVAEYMALATDLGDSSESSDFRRANQLSWELAMWLPEEIYKKMTSALTNATPELNRLTIVSEVRKLLLGDVAGNITHDHIAFHAKSTQIRR